MPTPTDQLEAARLELAASGAQGLALADSINDAQRTTRPAKGGWSPAECFAHLNLTTSAIFPLLEAGVQEARSQGWTAEGPLRVGLLARMLCWALEPPYRMKTATQPAFVPQGIPGKAEVLTAWREGHRALDVLIRDSVGLALDRPVIVSPFSPKGSVRYSVYAALLILAAHERRHLWQARRSNG